MNKKYFLIGFGLILLDQITKLLVKKEIKVFSFFSLERVTNTGALFGLFKGNNLVFIILSLIILSLIIFWFIKEKKSNIKFALILLISGLIGNLIDRIIYGFVVDFINFKFWYVFNFADCYIVLALFLLVYSETRK
ncbi:MAG: signal peptidase II [Candidatus Nanoarchaeia archaeon]|nr:signal peptidase II [Candidatus Nanoarchaeia archaeon]